MASSPSVEILIRAPSQRVDDFSLTCDVAWTIHKIKLQLSALYPTHPVSLPWVFVVVVSVFF